MADLQQRFGQLVAAHRRKRELSQESLAELANMSVDMVAKIEAGRSGARFGSISKLAAALDVDPAELFSAQIPSSALSTKNYRALIQRLAVLPDEHIAWLARIIEAVLDEPRSPVKEKFRTKAAEPKPRKRAR